MKRKVLIPFALLVLTNACKDIDQSLPLSETHRKTEQTASRDEDKILRQEKPLDDSTSTSKAIFSYKKNRVVPLRTLD